MCFDSTVYACDCNENFETMDLKREMKNHHHLYLELQGVWNIV